MFLFHRAVSVRPLLSHVCTVSLSAIFEGMAAYQWSCSVPPAQRTATPLFLFTALPRARASRPSDRLDKDLGCLCRAIEPPLQRHWLLSWCGFVFLEAWWWAVDMKLAVTAPVCPFGLSPYTRSKPSLSISLSVLPNSKA